MMFFNRYFIGNKQYYRSLELEIVYLVWVYKRLYILLYLNNRYIIMFTNHNIINNIVKSTNFNTTSINRANYCFINVSIYLFVYLLDVYHIFKHYNLVLNTFLYFQTLENDAIRTDNEAESTFDAI